MSWEFWILASFFVVVMGSVALVGRLMLGRTDKTQRDVARGVPLDLAQDEGARPATQAILARAFEFVGESVPSSKRDSEPIRKRLLMAGYRWPTAVTIFTGIRVASALAMAGVVGWMILLVKGDSSSTLIPALCGAGFGYLFPDRMLQARVRTRAKRIRSAVPSAVDLLVLALEAGQSLDQAMHDVAKALARSYPDLSEEFIFFHLEMRAGKSRYEALRHLSERSAEPELKKLAAVLLDGDRYGTSLGPALRTHARYLRTRVRQRAQESARKLSVKLTLPVFFLIFPSMLLVTLGPAYLQLRNTLGNLLTGL